ncbi:MAG: DUF1566 domain-containing protein [Deltaproteobacteria bacterium]|nr:DUF1566 domain-containing protein [Deltaproteobacteria bacterium]
MKTISRLLSCRERKNILSIKKKWLFVAAAMFSLSLSSSIASAGVDLAALCQAAKIKAAGKRVQCLALERAKTQLGRAADPGKCEADFDNALAKADAAAAAKGAACRYLDNGEGTISDLDTLLQWEKKDASGGIHDQDALYTWSSRQRGSFDGTAITVLVQGLNFNCQTALSTDGTIIKRGFVDQCDWRLPSVVELATLVDLNAPGCGSGSPCIDAVFNNGTDSFTQPAAYWSSSSHATSSLPAWLVNFNSGVGGFANKVVPLYVRVVRGGR